MTKGKIFTITINGIKKSYDDIVKLQDVLENFEENLSQLHQTIQNNNDEKEKSIKLSYDENASIKEKKALLEQLKEQYNSLNEVHRNSGEGNDLIQQIQLLEEEISILDKTIENHLNTIGLTGYSLHYLGEGLESATLITGSFSDIFSSSAEVLKLFGVESETLSNTITELSKITETLNTLQALHTSIVAKDSIVMKAATIIKKLYTAATQGSSLALKGFKAALVSTGVGAFIVLLGYLITHFEDIKKEIGNAVGGMDKFDAIMQKIEPVIAGVGNALLQFLLNPVKQVINAVEGLINVFSIFQEKGVDGFKDAFEEIKKTAQKGAQIQLNTLNVLKGFNDGYNESVIKSGQKTTKKIQEQQVQILDNHIKNMEAQKGADWKYTEEGIKIYDSYFAIRMAMYAKDSEEYQKLQREKWSFDRDITEHKKPKRIGGSGIKKDPNEYLKDLRNIQKETDNILSEGEQRQIEHLKSLAKSISSQDSLLFIQEAAKKEQELLSKEQSKQIEELQKHHSEMQEKYKGNAEKLKEINEAFESQLYALQEKHGYEMFDLKTAQNKELEEVENKIKEDNLKKTLKFYNKELDAAQKFIDERKQKSDKLNKDLVLRNDLGLINISKTKENYSKAIDADKSYLSDLELNHLKKMDIFDKELKAVGSNKEEVKAIQAKMAAENKSYADEKANINKRITENTKESTTIQQKYFEDLHSKMTEIWGKANQAITDVVTITKAIFQEQLNDITERLSKTTQQYDEVVNKRKETQSKIQSLEEEAKNASGGRATVIQEQIARQMEANSELAKQEQELAKKKEKLEKDKAKKEKQQKKVELGQQLITGIANVALGVTKALAMGPIIGKILAALTAAAGAIQTGIIARQMAKLEDGGLLHGKRHAQGGMRIEGTNIEVEGDEFVVNRESTRKNLGLINYINKNRKELSPADINSYFTNSGQTSSGNLLPTRRMYEDGGKLTNLEVIDSITAPTDDKILDAIARINFRPVVSVVDISNAQNRVTQIKDIAGA